MASGVGGDGGSRPSGWELTLLGALLFLLVGFCFVLAGASGGDNRALRFGVMFGVGGALAWWMWLAAARRKAVIPRAFAAAYLAGILGGLVLVFLFLLTGELPLNDGYLSLHWILVRVGMLTTFVITLIVVLARSSKQPR
jgi:hypothetical protein